MSAHGKHNYVKTWLVLLALLGVSVVGPMAEIPWLTLTTAFGIAFVKAYLVIRDFMHLPLEKPWIRWFLVTSIALMGVFFFGTAADIMKHEGRNWSNDASKAAVKRGIVDPHAEHAEDGHGSDEGGEHADGVDLDGAWARCVACHGEGGKGDGVAGAALTPKPRDFTEGAWQDKVDDAHIKKVIGEGGGAVGLSPIMAANPDFDDATLDALVAKIRGLKAG